MRRRAGSREREREESWGGLRERKMRVAAAAA
jgi:hypothetical protein